MLDSSKKRTIVDLGAERKGGDVSYCACKNDPVIWEKRSKRDRLSIEIIAAFLQPEIGILHIYYYAARVLYQTLKYFRAHTFKACASCLEREKCAPLLYEAYQSLLNEIRETRERMLKCRTRWFPLSPALHFLDRAIEIYSDKVEDFSFVKNEESRAALAGLAQACKEAGPKLDDWRKSMDFLH